MVRSFFVMFVILHLKKMTTSLHGLRQCSWAKSFIRTNPGCSISCKTWETRLWTKLTWVYWRHAVINTSATTKHNSSTMLSTFHQLERISTFFLPTTSTTSLIVSSPNSTLISGHLELKVRITGGFGAKTKGGGADNFVIFARFEVIVPLLYIRTPFGASSYLSTGG